MRITSLLLSLSIAASAAQPALAASLTSEQIQTSIIGQRLVVQYQGVDSKALYDPSGLVRISGSSLAGQGSWTLDAGSLCITMTTGPRLGQTCVTIDQRGDGSYAMSDGTTFSLGR